MNSVSSKPYTAKRALDVLVAGTACAAFAPLVAGIAVATWLEDSGSPLFAQHARAACHACRRLLAQTSVGGLPAPEYPSPVPFVFMA